MTNAKVRNWVRQLRSYMVTGNMPAEIIARQRRVARSQKPVQGRSGGWSRNSDPLMRKRVENAAIRAVRRHFGESFLFTDVSKLNCGWDITARSGRTELLLEVKGLSGGSICAEMTPGELKYMERHNRAYRLCIVTAALKASRVVHVFRWDEIIDQWIDVQQPSRRLKLEEIIGARVTL